MINVCTGGEISQSKIRAGGSTVDTISVTLHEAQEIVSLP